MATMSSIAIRRARRDDVGTIVAMLADDPLGSARERLENPLPQSYFQAFEAVDRDPNIHLVVAQDGEADVVGCLQLCVLPGLSSQGASRGLIEDVRVAASWRSRGIGEQMVQWAVTEALSGVASWSNCSPTRPERMPSVSISGSDFSRAMSA